MLFKKVNKKNNNCKQVQIKTLKINNFYLFSLLSKDSKSADADAS